MTAKAILEELKRLHCQNPFAPDYIRKVQKHGAIGKKRKSVKY